jgi:poly(A) polymerase
MLKKFIAKVIERTTGKKPQARKPRVLAVAEHGIDRARLSRGALGTVEGLHKAGYQAYVVGGAVRDLLLGGVPKDFDVATDATPEQVHAVFRRSRIIGRRFRIVHVLFGQETVEVSTFRTADLSDAPTDEHGRVLRDNTYGSMADDATRRDFTVNALYYDPDAQTVIDHHGGVADLKKKLLRIIGDPATRYREDPVRMLRVTRFAARLGFAIDPKTRAPIRELAGLLANVPSSRLFDEMMKLLLSGHAVACIRQLRDEQLHHGLLPLLDVILEQPMGEKFVMLALARTDERIGMGKGVSPGFLFAALLWHEALAKWNELKANGEHATPALFEAMGLVIDAQREKLAIQHRIAADMREIWALQPRLDRRGRAAAKLLEHPRFRAAYDFLLLRAQSGEIDTEVAEWWTTFIDAAPETRTEMMTPKAAAGDGAPRKRRRRRRAATEGDTAPPPP